MRCTALVALIAAPLICLAQQPEQSRPRPLFAPSGRETAACSGQRVDEIVVYSEAPTVANLKRAPLIARVARTIHVTTRSDVIQRFLLLEPGKPCNELRRAESERILRAQPFLSLADIYVIPNDHGGVDLEIRTSDEGSIVIGGSIRARAPQLSSLLLGNANAGGTGVFVAGSWRYGEGFRDGYYGRVVDRQFLDFPVVATLEGERASRGGTWRTELEHPFYTDLQRTAWRAQSGGGDTYIEVRRPDNLRPSVFLHRNYFDIGGIARVGPPGKLSLFGASLTGVDEFSGTRLTTGDSGFATDVGPLPRNYVAHRVTRANLLLGLREIGFVRRDGLDALTGPQDIPVGFQIGGLIGHSIPWLGSRESDSFLSGDLYAGSVVRSGVLRLQARAEARRISGSDVWDGILTSGRLTHSVQHGNSDVSQATIEWSGEVRQRTPFQLLAGQPEGGVRGYENSAWAGGRRLVARVENRHWVGEPLHLADAAIGYFADVGRIWAGDVPFGRTTPVIGSVGLSLLGAAPPHSGRTWRADLALPIGPEAAGRWTLTLTNVDRSRFVFREPSDVSQNREPTVPTSIFAWP